MTSAGVSFMDVSAVSGSGQQHGSVYWAAGAGAKLGALAGGRGPLKAQLAGAFSVPASPIWMDSSTGAQCAALEGALGGPAAVAALTGSRAYERFTGNQVAKVAAHAPAAWAATERVSLISSAMASVLAGAYAPIDFSDGAGMNVMDLKTREWAPAVLRAWAAAAPGLGAKLGPTAPSHARVGSVAPYFAAAHGFNPAASVIAWSGDNPCSVAGLGLREPGDVAVSLGTSDTMFGITASPAPGVEGHIFVNPVDPTSYMAMLCYKNGSVTRERVMREAAGGSWDAFNALLARAPAGNGGYVGFFHDQPEITPAVKRAGVRRFGPDGRPVAAFPSPAHEARAVVEGQFMSLRVHGESIGLTRPRRVIATGGASANAAITQVLADVFGVPVFVAAQTDSASLGAAYRAMHGQAIVDAAGAFVPFERVQAAGAGNVLTQCATPNAAAHAAITAALPAYRAAEAKVVAEAQ